MPWKPLAAVALGALVAVLVAGAVLALGRVAEPEPPGVVRLLPSPSPASPPTAAPDGGSAGVLVPPPVPLDTTPTTVAPPTTAAPPRPAPAPPAPAAPAPPPDDDDEWDDDEWDDDEWDDD